MSKHQMVKRQFIRSTAFYLQLRKMLLRCPSGSEGRSCIICDPCAYELRLRAAVHLVLQVQGEDVNPLRDPGRQRLLQRPRIDLQEASQCRCRQCRDLVLRREWSLVVKPTLWLCGCLSASCRYPSGAKDMDSERQLLVTDLQPWCKHMAITTRMLTCTWTVLYLATSASKAGSFGSSRVPSSRVTPSSVRNSCLHFGESRAWTGFVIPSGTHAA